MSTIYAPGTVAKVTLRRLMADGKPRANDAGDTYLAFWDDYNRQWVSAEAGALATAGDFWHFDVRPLVVLDLDEAPRGAGNNYPQWLLQAASSDQASSGRTNYRPGFLRWLADQVETQTRPPRIPEPGLWGVVEATGATMPRRRWIHHEEDRWVCDTGVWRYWDDLVDPVLIRDGIEDES